MDRHQEPHQDPGPVVDEGDIPHREDPGSSSDGTQKSRELDHPGYEAEDEADCQADVDEILELGLIHGRCVGGGGNKYGGWRRGMLMPSHRG